jgi:hypothetical protein
LDRAGLKEFVVILNIYEYQSHLLFFFNIEKR